MQKESGLIWKDMVLCLNRKYNNSSFWKEAYNFLFPKKLFEETNEQVENVLKLVDFHGSSVLDRCCGDYFSMRIKL